MKKKENVIFSLIYPSLGKYLLQFTDSVKKQDCQNFDLLLINNEFKIDKKTKLLFPKNTKTNNHISANAIQFYNFMGLTNSSVKTIIFKKYILSKINFENINIQYLKTIGCLFFSIALLNNIKAIFTNETCTQYRIYENNITGYATKITKAHIEYTIDRKIDLYGIMIKINCKYNFLYKKYLNLKIKFQSNIWLNNEYKKIINNVNKRNNVNYLWNII